MSAATVYSNVRTSECLFFSCINRRSGSVLECAQQSTSRLGHAVTHACRQRRVAGRQSARAAEIEFENGRR